MEIMNFDGCDYIVERNISEFPSRFKIGDKVFWADQEAFVIDIKPNVDYPQKTIENHIKCDTYIIKFFIFENERIREVADEDLKSPEEYKEYREKHWDYY